MSENSKFRWRLREFGRLLSVSHMLKHTEQVGFTTRRRPLCSHPQSRAVAIHISISYTDKLPFPLPGRFPHERMKCKRFDGFADARHVAFQVPTETGMGGEGTGVLEATADKYATNSFK